MFIELKESEKPVQKPKKIFLKAPPEQRDRLHRRAIEVLPGLEIVSENAEHYYISSRPDSEFISKLEKEFSVRAEKLSSELKNQAYLLKANNDELFIFSSHAEGLYYAMLSLSECLNKNYAEIDLFDYPVFARRGFLQDLSRGQVLNKAGFERLAEALSFFRYNWLTFNLEHNFGYEKHPDIPGQDDKFLKEEAKALFELCREHYIEIVPMQQSLGHCRGILSRKKYSHLAFDEKLLWSLDPRKDEIYSLLNDLFEEQAECFPGRYFLVGCDEPFDLKRYWKPELADGKSFPKIYLEHIIRLNKILSPMGRKMMVWGDIFVEHPELIPELPEDIIIINWQYGTANQEGEDFYLNKCKKIAESGGNFYVATTTWSYARLYPELKTMECNNRNFLKAGAELGAKGALLTNWGDLGHMQLLGYIGLPLAYFAFLSFRQKELSIPEFSKEFAKHFFNDPSGKSGDLYLLLDRINEVVSPGKFLGSSALFVLLDELFSNQFIPQKPLSEISDELLKIVKEIESITSELINLKNGDWILDLKPIIYALGILFSKFMIQENAPFYFQDPSKKQELLILFGHLSTYFQNFALSFRDRWLLQAKPAGLERILKRLVKVVEGYQKRIFQLKEKPPDSFEKFRDDKNFSEYKFNLIKELGLEGLI